VVRRKILGFGTRASAGMKRGASTLKRSAGNLKVKTSNFGRNAKLVTQAERLLFRNRNGRIIYGDSLPVYKTLQLVKKSNLPENVKKKYVGKLNELFKRHYEFGVKWAEARNVPPASARQRKVG
jgi:hypothetical protein